MTYPKPYIDGKCSPHCSGGHPIAKNTILRRVARRLDWLRHGWVKQASPDSSKGANA